MGGVGEAATKDAAGGALARTSTSRFRVERLPRPMAAPPLDQPRRLPS